jgi:Co/Zn/Cd efflux system component
VWATGTAWPDLIVAGIMATLFLWSSAQIVRQALTELRTEKNFSVSALSHKRHPEQDTATSG